MVFGFVSPPIHAGLRSSEASCPFLSWWSLRQAPCQAASIQPSPLESSHRGGVDHRGPESEFQQLTISKHEALYRNWGDLWKNSRLSFGWLDGRWGMKWASSEPLSGSRFEVASGFTLGTILASV